MSKLDHTEIKQGVYFKLDNVIYECVDSVFSKKSRQQGSNNVKIRNLSNGSVISKTLHQSDKLSEVDIERENIIFVYRKGSNLVFSKENNSSDRFELDEKIVDSNEFLKTGLKLKAVVNDENILNASLPIKVDLIVKEAPPSIKGNTASGGSKKVLLETGVLIDVPLFIETGDIIRINTEKKIYTERVSKN